MKKELKEKSIPFDRRDGVLAVVYFSGSEDASAPIKKRGPEAVV